MLRDLMEIFPWSTSIIGIRVFQTSGNALDLYAAMDQPGTGNFRLTDKSRRLLMRGRLFSYSGSVLDCFHAAMLGAVRATEYRSCRLHSMPNDAAPAMFAGR